jgi:hypothetical protein
MQVASGVNDMQVRVSTNGLEVRDALSGQWRAPGQTEFDGALGEAVREQRRRVQ